MGNTEPFPFTNFYSFSPDRKGLQNVEEVRSLQTHLLGVLEKFLYATHAPDALVFHKCLQVVLDLRVLNHKYSEKLLAHQKD